MSAEDDATIRRQAAPPLRVEWGRAPPVPVSRPPRRRAWPWLGAGGLVLAGIGGWWLMGGGPPEAPAPAPPPSAPTVTPAPPPITPPPETTPLTRLAQLPPLMDEAAIRDHRADRPRLLRLAGHPAVFLIDYPTLAAQGAALNRVAALVEKAGLPRDRVLTEAEMAAAIARNGDTPATFYFGHNYRGTDLARFFALAAAAGLPLSEGEEWLRGQFLLARGLVPPGQEIMLLSIAAPGPEMDAAGRAAILHHELSHGRFGTDMAYAAHIRRVWQDRFTEAERAAFRAFLGREGYDTAVEEMMIDEAQAYLLHTPDPRFFDAGHLGLTAADLERLRGLMRDGMP